MRTTPIAIALALLVPFLGAGPASADPALLASGGGSGGAWVSARLPAGEPASLVFTAKGFVGPGGLITCGYDDVQWRYCLLASQGGQLLDVGAEAVGVSVSQTQDASDGQGWIVSLCVNLPGCPAWNGTIRFVIVAATPEQWSYELRGGGADPASALAGDDAFASGPSGFGGGLDAHAGALGENVGVDVGSEHDVDVQGTLVGFYVGSDPGVAPSNMTMVTPRGETACPCLFPHVDGPDALGPGAYAFRVTGVSAGAGVLLVGASVRLPP